MKINIAYYNSFWAKSVKDSDYAPNVPQWPGLPWFDGSTNYPNTNYPVYPFGSQTKTAPSTAGSYNTTYPASSRMWFIEESRIKGGYNNTSIDYGVRAYLVDDNKLGSFKGNYLIYSGIFNSKSNFNQTNVFSNAEPITRSLDPAFGDIQKLYSAETNLLVFQELKTSKILVNKNQSYNNLEGSVDNNRVLGQVDPYAGMYGIGRSPESFASYANRRYFVDKDKGAVLRLSLDGHTEISNYGMRDFFRDSLNNLNDQFLVYNTKDNSGSIKIEIEIPPSSTDLFEVILKNIDCCDVNPGSILSLDDPSNPGTSIELINTNTNEPIYVTSIDCATNEITLSSANNLANISPSPVTTYNYVWNLTTPGTGYIIGTSYTTTTITGSGSGAIVTATATNGDGSVINGEFANGYVAGDIISVNGGGVKAELTLSLVPNTGGWQYVYLQNNYKSKIYGGYDIHNGNYTMSMQVNSALISDSTTTISGDGQLNDSTNTYKTLSYDETVKGWVSFYSFKPTWMDSLRNVFISTYESGIYYHYDQSVANNRGKFYTHDIAESNITFLFNASPSISKTFKTVSYEGSSGWQVSSIKSDFEGMNYFNSSFSENQDVVNSVKSYLEGRYELNNPVNTGTSAVVHPFGQAGFDRKENKYVANIVNNSVARPGEVIFGNQMSGIKGFFTETKFAVDNVTEPGGMKELFSVSANFVKSS